MSCEDINYSETNGGVSKEGMASFVTDTEVIGIVVLFYPKWWRGAFNCRWMWPGDSGQSEAAYFFGRVMHVNGRGCFQEMTSILINCRIISLFGLYMNRPKSIIRSVQTRIGRTIENIDE